MTDPIEILEQLSEAVGPSGREEEVRALVLDLVKPLADEVRVDALGNVIATRHGRREQTLMLDAHMDEVGFLAQFVDEGGFVRIAPVGGWDARVLPSHAVTLRTRAGDRLRGVIGSRPPHILSQEERNRAIPIEDLFVDFGLGKAELESRGVRLGDGIVPHYPFERLDDDLVLGKAFDDRAGCTVLLETLRRLRDDDPDLTVVGAFTVGEEIGLRGAQTAAFQIRPDVAIALEGTTATDVPGVAAARRPAVMGGGAALTISDNRLIADVGVLSLLEECAQDAGARWQHKIPGFGGTDAGVIHITGAGARCGVVSVPCRYIHTPLAMLRPSDLMAAIEVTTAFCRRAGSLV